MRTPLFPDYYWPLYNFAAEHQPQNGLEIGYCWGESAHAFLMGSPRASLLSIDIQDYTKEVAVLNEEVGGRLKFKQGDSTTILPLLRGLFDYIYIDGDHSYEQVKIDTLNAVQIIRPGGIIVWDDYDKWSDVKLYLDKTFGILTAVPDHGNGARWRKF